MSRHQFSSNFWVSWFAYLEHSIQRIKKIGICLNSSSVWVKAILLVNSFEMFGDGVLTIFNHINFMYPRFKHKTRKSNGWLKKLNGQIWPFLTFLLTNSLYVWAWVSVSLCVWRKGEKERQRERVGGCMKQEKLCYTSQYLCKKQKTIQGPPTNVGVNELFNMHVNNK